MLVGEPPENPMQAHPHSIKLSKRAGEILDWVTVRGPRTDRQVAREMGFGQNLNAVRPRITELICDGLLMEVCSVICPTTKKRVRLVDLRSPRSIPAHRQPTKVPNLPAAPAGRAGDHSMALRAKINEPMRGCAEENL